MVRASPIFGTIYKSLVHLIVDCNMGLHVERRTMNTKTNNNNNSHGKCESSNMNYVHALDLQICCQLRHSRECIVQQQQKQQQQQRQQQRQQLRTYWCPIDKKNFRIGS
ncbi:unnamed protein product [Polarella glacialis]|uniref:Uncharacterized protein n=1 Tax=Polarella glacialis TaxID=89957 RepID=A0A813J3E1_POLGL|nr:unnamed protein product [Polarella glacialis]